MSGDVSCCSPVTHCCGGFLSTAPFSKSKDCWKHLGCGRSQCHVDIDYFSMHGEVQQATTTPAQCDGGQKNTEKAQKRGWESYSSDPPSVWALALCFKDRRFEIHIEGDAKFLQMIAALFCLALSSCHSSLISPCHLRAKGLCLWCMELHQSRAGLALAGGHNGLY